MRMSKGPQKQNQQAEFIMLPKVDFCFKELMTDSDVRVLLNDQVEIDIEIQVLLFPFWEERSLFYLCKMFSDQIKEGESYQAMEKCIHVGILDYILFPEDEEYYSRFHFKEDNRDRIYSDKLEIHILELPKLENKEYPKGALLNWAKFFRAEQKEELKAMAKTDQYIEKAYNKLVHISDDEEKRLAYEARQKAIRDYNHLMKCSWDDGLRQGLTREIHLIRRKLEQGMRADEIAEWMELEKDYIDAIEKMCQTNQEITDVEIVALLQKTQFKNL